MPVMCRMISVSRPFSLVSVVMRRPPRQRSRLFAQVGIVLDGVQVRFVGQLAAASRTSSLPVTTSATSRVRYSRRSSISRSSAAKRRYRIGQSSMSAIHRYPLLAQCGGRTAH